jgi:sugar O-acyltransferase (sialic acid O-acetyltransferase NeuD family)
MNLVLLGGGGHGKVCAAVAGRAGWNVLGFLAPSPSPALLEGCSWLGTDEWLDSDASKGDCAFLVSVGQIMAESIRPRLFRLLDDRKLSVATLVARSAVVMSSARVGRGSAILEQAVIGPAAVVGQNCIINTGAIVEHDAEIGDHCHVSTAVVVNGNCRIGSGTMLGSAAVVLQGVKICAGALIGAGAVVVADIAEPGKWVGVPARRVT